MKQYYILTILALFSSDYQLCVTVNTTLPQELFNIWETHFHQPFKHTSPTCSKWTERRSYFDSNCGWNIDSNVVKNIDAAVFQNVDSDVDSNVDTIFYQIPDVNFDTSCPAWWIKYWLKYWL